LYWSEYIALHPYRLEEGTRERNELQDDGAPEREDVQERHAAAHQGEDALDESVHDEESSNEEEESSNEDEWMAKKRESLKARREESRRRARQGAHEKEGEGSSSSSQLLDAPCSADGDQVDEDGPLPRASRMPSRSGKRKSILDSDDDDD
jgi:hypothetical protein